MEIPDEIDVISFGLYVGDDKCNIIHANRVEAGKKHIGNCFLQYKYSNIHVCSIAFARTFLNKYHIRFKEKCRMTEDKVFVEMALYCADNVLFVDEPFFIYRYNSDSVMHVNKNTGYKKLIDSYEARMWESREIIKKRSYSKESDAAIQRSLECLAVGALLELLQSYFRNTINVMIIKNELDGLGLYDMVKRYDDWDLPTEVNREFRLFNKYPAVFALKYRIKWIIRTTAKNILPKSVVIRRRRV